MLNKKGLTLIEVLIAALITLILFLALMQSALLSIDSNMINVLRDEAVGIAEARMRELRSLPFTDAGLAARIDNVENPITRDFRNFQRGFTPTVTITDLPPGNPTAKQIGVLITWEWKEKTVVNGNAYTHTITSIKRR